MRPFGLTQPIVGQLYGQRSIETYIIIARVEQIEAFVLPQIVLGAWHLHDASMTLCSAGMYHLEALRLCDMRVDMGVLLDDASLLPCDLRQCVAQQLCVLQCQGSDARSPHIAYNICAVQFATDAHLQHQDIHLLGNEDMETQDGHEGKETGHV